MIVWRGNASIITGHGYYFVQCDGNEVTIAGEGAFVPWSTLFNLLQAKLYSHRESDEEGCVFWVGDSENVLIPGTYMSIRPSLENWNCMDFEWEELNEQFNNLLEHLLWKVV